MSFLAPAAFALALLLPVIIALYLLRLRRTERVVSSTYLWRRMVRDLEANAPWQRLRRNLLLILQLLVLSALILALARPFTWAEGSSGKTAIVILDTSASMAATDVTPNRLEAAKAQALRQAEDLPDDAQVTVIAAADGAKVLASSSQDPRQVRTAIQSARIGEPGAGSDLTAALELAAAIAARQPDTETMIFSDGRVGLPDHTAIKGQVRYWPMGISGENAAVSALSLQPAPGGGLTAFVQVTNYGQAPIERRLALYHAGTPARESAPGRALSAHDLELEPGKPHAVVIQDLPPDTSAIEVRLLTEDVLTPDDRAWAVHQAGEPARVTLVTAGNLFLETALSLLPNLEVTTTRPRDWDTGDRVSAGGQSAHLTILDAYVPLTTTLPAGNLLFIAPPSSTEVFSVTGRLVQPAPRAVHSSGTGVDRDPLLDNVDVSGVGVQEAMRVSLPAWARPVIVGDVVTADGAQRSSPLLWAGEAGGRRVALLAFDLRRSDLPLQVAFPLLLANLTAWLAPLGSSDLPAQVTPGTAVSLAVPPDVQEVWITRPDGSQARLEPERSRATYGDTAQLGIYKVEWEGGEAHFAVNLFLPGESDLLPAGSLPLTETAEGTGEASEEPDRMARREWWRALALAALILLLIEWLVYHRATVARLWSGAISALRPKVDGRKRGFSEGPPGS
jgi:hypothetical protein